MSYKKYLYSKHWLSFREQALFAAKYECEECGYDENLNVHHLSYKSLGHETLNDVQVLCYRCHMQAHEDINYAKVYHCKKEPKKPDIENILDALGICEDDEVIMYCSSCRRLSILAVIYHTGKAGCQCRDEHQRWMIDIEQLITTIATNNPICQYVCK